MHARRLSHLQLLVAAGAPALALSACSNENDLNRQRQPPTADIVDPLDGASFRQGTGAVALTGLASDSYDEPSSLLVTFTAGDLELPVATDSEGVATSSLSIDDLALGALHVVLTVTDTDGESATDSIDLWVGGPLGAPTVDIVLPEDGAVYALTDSINFMGEASDATTAPDDLSFAWSSDLDGDLAGAVSSDGVSLLFVAGLSAGLHTVTLLATDDDGEIGSDSISVTVEAEPVEVEPGDLIFSEMMVNPSAVEDEQGEWVELYNTSGAGIDVAGYTFRDDDVDAWVLEGPLVVDAYSYIVLCADVDPLLNGGVPCDGWFNRDSTGKGLALANGEDELVLTRPDGIEIDWLHYDSTWYTAGIALGLAPDWLEGGANDDVTHWCNQSTITAPMTEPGTPGQANDACKAPK